MSFRVQGSGIRGALGSGTKVGSAGKPGGIHSRSILGPSTITQPSTKHARQCECRARVGTHLAASLSSRCSSCRWLWSCLLHPPAINSRHDVTLPLEALCVLKPVQARPSGGLESMSWRVPNVSPACSECAHLRLCVTEERLRLVRYLVLPRKLHRHRRSLTHSTRRIRPYTRMLGGRKTHADCLVRSRRGTH